MAAKPQPHSAAGLAREFYLAHSHLTTAKDLLDALATEKPDTPPAQYSALRLAFQRLLAGTATVDGHMVKNAEATPAMQVVIEEEEATWQVQDNHYVWENKTQGKRFYRSVADVDEMFYAYSQHGQNLSQTQMLHDFGLSMWEWNTLKGRLLLQKLSNVFSPWTVSQTPPEELQSMMEAKMARRYDRLGPFIERAHRNAAVKELNRVLKLQSEKDQRMQSLALELSDLLPEVKFRYVARAPKHTDGPEHMVFTIADPHIGAKVKQLLNAPAYNSDVLYHYADQLIERVNARGAANVYLAGLGDFVESWTGMNHPNTWMQMDVEKVGAGGLKAALEFFSYLVERIHNIKEIWGVSGNHDRSSADKKQDTKGEVAEMLFMLLAERYRHTGIALHYAYDLLVREVDGICYLLTHMHLGLAGSDRRLQETIARHRIPGLYCVVFGAHLHSRITKMDTDDSRVVHSPSLFTGNTYSSDGGWSTLAGFLTSENIAGSGYPRIADEPLFPSTFANRMAA